jgi:hypothetical protein
VKPADTFVFQARYRVLERLQTCAGFSGEKIQEIKDWVVMRDYFRRDDHEGGLMLPGTEFYRRGKLHTFDDVALGVLLETVEFNISKLEPKDTRTRIYEQVVAGIAGRKRVPKWATPIIHPHEKPATQFSASRAVRPCHLRKYSTGRAC